MNVLASFRESVTPIPKRVIQAEDPFEALARLDAGGIVGFSGHFLTLDG